MSGDYPTRSALCSLFEPGDLARAGQPLERLVLDAANALRREPEALAGLAERRRLVAVDPVAEPDHLLLLLREVLERAVDSLLAEADLHLLDGLGRVAREELAQLGVALLADGALEAGDGAAELARLPQLPHGDVRPLSKLLVGGRPAELHGQLALGLRDLALALADVNRETDRPALVREAALDRLPDPEGRVGRELVALAPVELLGGRRIVE